MDYDDGGGAVLAGLVNEAEPCCECCGTNRKLINMPFIMAHDHEGRFVCSDCFGVWYDGVTCSEEIARIVLSRRAALSQNQTTNT